MSTQTLLGLDKSQREFCESDAKNIRLLAPAGCGKTLSLAHRCLHLAQTAGKAKPRFLVVTFTVAARDEFHSRIHDDDTFAELRGSVEVSTLNSWGFRRVRNEAFSPKLVTSRADYHFAMPNQLQPIWKKHKAVREAIEAKKNTAPRKIMDLMDAFKSMGFDHRRDSNLEKFERRIESFAVDGLQNKWESLLIELARQGVIPKVTRDGSEEVVRSPKLIYDSFFKFWREATQHLVENDTFTLEDQKYVAYLDEQNKVDEGKVLSGAARYDHLLVDEFQDINPLDLALLRAIADRNRSTITIVGDDDQAIFEWRGATPRYIVKPNLYFRRKFSTFTLDTNYRSPRNIVEIAQRVIVHNENRVGKAISSNLDEDAFIEVVTTSGLPDSMSCVIAECERALDAGEDSQRVAVIGRKKSQIIPYQLYFASNDIPFCAAEDLQIFMSTAFDRLMKLILIKCNAGARRTTTQVNDDVLALCDLAKRYPLSKADKAAFRGYLISERPKTINDAIAALTAYTGQLKGKNKGGEMSLQFADKIASFINASCVAGSVNALAESFEGLQTDLGKAEDDVFYVDPPFLHLAEYATRYGDDYGQFIDDIEAAKEKLAYLPPVTDPKEVDAMNHEWRRPIHLMTAPRAKGKEFDTVILLDVNEGIWPNKNATTEAELEAERRVFYVAFTRVKQRLLLLVNETIGKSKAEPSRYLKEAGLV